MNRAIGILFGVVLLMAIAALTAIGLRIAPMEQAANSAESRQTCEVEAPESLRSSAQEWCANGLFANVKVTEQPENIITVAQFNTNGSHVWQLQSANLLGSFRMLTEKMAANAKGRNVGISIQDGADERIAACARLIAESGGDLRVEVSEFRAPASEFSFNCALPNLGGAQFLRLL